MAMFNIDLPNVQYTIEIVDLPNSHSYVLGNLKLPIFSPGHRVVVDVDPDPPTWQRMMWFVVTSENDARSDQLEQFRHGFYHEK